MKRTIFHIISGILLSVGSVAEADIIGARPVNFKAVGVYEGADQDNTVDKSAGFDSAQSMGSGDDEYLVVGFDDFTALLARAFEMGFGGVVNFDNDTIKAENEVDSFSVYFGRKTLKVSSSAYLCTDMMTNSCTPISGPASSDSLGYVTKSGMGDSYMNGGILELSFQEIGFTSGEHVRAIAGTILGCDGGAADEDSWLMKALLDNGDIIAVSASVNVVSGNATDDTFFGVYAPAGRYITGVAWIGGSETFSGLDGLAFITSKRDLAITRPDEVPEVDEEPAEESWEPSGSSGVYVGGSGLFGSSTPYGGTYRPPADPAPSTTATNSESGDDSQSSTNTDYSALFGSDRAGTQ